MQTKFIAFRFIVFLILTLGLSLGAWAATLEEVVVTAQKREQSLQDVSTAVSAVDMNRLVNAHINNLQDSIPVHTSRLLLCSRACHTPAGRAHSRVQVQAVLCHIQ